MSNAMPEVGDLVREIDQSTVLIVEDELDWEHLHTCTP